MSRARRDTRRDLYARGAADWRKPVIARCARAYPMNNGKHSQFAENARRARPARPAEPERTSIALWLINNPPVSGPESQEHPSWWRVGGLRAREQSLPNECTTTPHDVRAGAKESPRMYGRRPLRPRCTTCVARGTTRRTRVRPAVRFRKMQGERRDSRLATRAERSREVPALANALRRQQHLHPRCDPSRKGRTSPFCGNWAGIVAIGGGIPHWFVFCSCTVCLRVTSHCQDHCVVCS
jgi:hypothetical protein